MSTAEWDDALLFEVAIDPFQQIAISGKEEGRQAGLCDGYNEGVNIGRSKGWEIGLELGYIHDFSQGILDGYLKKKSCCSGGGDEGDQVQTSSQESTPQHQPQHTTEHRTRSHRLERCLTLARDLIDMIDKFPDPDTLLSQNQVYDSMKSDIVEAEEVSPTKKDCCTKITDGQCTTADDSCCRKEEDSNDDKQMQAAPREDSKQMAMLDISTSLERIRAKFKLLCVLLKTKQSFDLKTVLDLGDDISSKKRMNADQKKSSTPSININNKGEDKGDTKIESESSKNNMPIQDVTALESDW